MNFEQHELPNGSIIEVGHIFKDESHRVIQRDGTHSSAYAFIVRRGSIVEKVTRDTEDDAKYERVNLLNPVDQDAQDKKVMEIMSEHATATCTRVPHPSYGSCLSVIADGGQGMYLIAPNGEVVA